MSDIPPANAETEDAAHLRVRDRGAMAGVDFVVRLFEVRSQFRIIEQFGHRGVDFIIGHAVVEGVGSLHILMVRRPLRTANSQIAVPKRRLAWTGTVLVDEQVRVNVRCA